MEGQDVMRFEEPRLENEDEHGLKACLFVKRMAEARHADAAAYEGT